MPKPNDLKLLEKVKERAEELRKEKAKAVDRIRKGFVKRAIVFMDVVGSTAFKVDHREEPEVWILRVQQFSELMASAAESCNGTVVKYIGDEIMVSFENAYDAQNLIGRVAEIEKNLKTGTGFETRLKVAADYGAVYGLNFDGHEPPDPQGTTVDRCARIAKFGMPGEVLASADFVAESGKLKWVKVGRADLKGIGPTVLFQLERATADLAARVEVRKRDYDALNEERDDLRARAARLEAQNRSLEEKLRAAGGGAGPRRPGGGGRRRQRGVVRSTPPMPRQGRPPSRRGGSAAPPGAAARATAGKGDGESFLIATARRRHRGRSR